MGKIDTMTVATGRRRKENDEIVNIADLIEAIASSGVKLTGCIIPDSEAVPIKVIGSVNILTPYDNLVIMPDVVTLLGPGATGAASISIDIINFKYIGVFADLKATTINIDLMFEVSIDEIEWHPLETVSFVDPVRKDQYFVLKTGTPIIANYIRVTPKNNGASDITLPYIRLVMKG